LAKEYGLLPSEVVTRATTFDLMVTDVLATYESYEYHKAQGKLMPTDGAYEEEELKAILEKARNNEQHRG
jgi:hypothetical protein